MARWRPDAYGRLQQAALELFSERGYDGVTVAEIAQRAGLTKRTYFRHFADKREVLFSGSELLEELVVAELAASSGTLAPLDAVVSGLRTAAETMFEQRREAAARRQLIIDANPELKEREIIKRSSLADVITAALRDRGVAAATAVLVASAATTIFRVAFAQWTSPDNAESLARLIDRTLERFRDAAAS
jgi:AcrR family transcriptional regulator